MMDETITRGGQGKNEEERLCLWAEEPSLHLGREEEGCGSRDPSLDVGEREGINPSSSALSKRTTESL